MTPALRRTAELLALLVVALLTGALTPAAAQEAEPEAPPQVVVTLTAEGATPEFIEVPVGGTVVFQNGDSTAHRVSASVEEGKSTAWEYDSNLIPPGETSAATPAFAEPGRYVFVDNPLFRATYTDEIGVLPPPAPEPSPAPSEEPVPGESPAPGAEPSASAPAGGAPAPSGSAGASP